jgi:hypothetical protein
VFLYEKSIKTDIYAARFALNTKRLRFSLGRFALTIFFRKNCFFDSRRTVRALEINQSIKYAKKVLLLNKVLLLKIETENGKVRYGKDTVSGLNSEPLLCSNLL